LLGAFGIATIFIFRCLADVYRLFMRLKLAIAVILVVFGVATGCRSNNDHHFPEPGTSASL
jgi:hypothetical protein